MLRSPTAECWCRTPASRRPARQTGGLSRSSRTATTPTERGRRRPRCLRTTRRCTPRAPSCPTAASSSSAASTTSACSSRPTRERLRPRLEQRRRSRRRRRPGSWSHIGDAPAVFLANGSCLVGASAFLGNTVEAILTRRVSRGRRPDGQGGRQRRGGFTLLPSGRCSPSTRSRATRNTEIYDPASGTGPAQPTPAALITARTADRPAVWRTARCSPRERQATALYDTATARGRHGPPPMSAGALVPPTPRPLTPDVRASRARPCNRYPPPAHFYLFDGRI